MDARGSKAQGETLIGRGQRKGTRLNSSDRAAKPCGARGLLTQKEAIATEQNYQLFQGDCLEVMKQIPDGSVDLTVTSPPYDNLRTYNGNIAQWSFEKFQGIAQELFRVTKQGGVVVWIVADATIRESETGTSFRQALFFQSVGFNLHDTMIWRKTKVMPRDPRIPRYWQGFEYMFVFSKGKPTTCNHIMVDAIHAGKTRTCGTRSPDGSIRMDRYEKTKGGTVKDKKVKDNVWEYATAQFKGHPAPFPEQLANDHIISWSNPGDLIFDPFMGSGTTAKMALLNGRRFIGIELDPGYYEIARKRVEEAYNK